MTNNPWRPLAAKMGPDGKPLIEGLRQPCEKCKGTGTCYHTRFGPQLAPRYPKYEDAFPCPVCAGSGRVLVEGPEAIVAAQEYILSRRWALTIERVGDKVQVIIHKGQVGFVGDSSPWLAAALAQALERALGKEKP